jgi:hypothetical protein
MACSRFRFRPEFSAEITLDDILALLDDVNNLRHLAASVRSFARMLASMLARSRTDLRVHGPDAVNVAESDVDPLLARNVDTPIIRAISIFYSACRCLCRALEQITRMIPFAAHDLAVFAKLFN